MRNTRWLRGLAAQRALALVCAWLGVVYAERAVADTLGSFQETTVFSGLESPTAIRFAPDGRIFVAEKGGRLKVFNGLGDSTPDIAADLSTAVYNNWDRGLLGLAIDPQFPAPGHDYVYVLYSVDAPPGGTPPVYNDACADQTGTGCLTRGRLSRLRIGPNNTTIGSEQILIDNRWCFQYPSHSIGDLHFGPEGALYLSAGEGASFLYTDYGQQGNPCSDPANQGGSLRSQDILTQADPQSWDGTLVRLDVSGPTAVPWPTNATVGGSTSDDDAIIAHGMRNPFRFTIHPGPGPQTGELWIGDVGSSLWEELDRMSSPNGPLLNFGWPCFEGGSGTSLRLGAFDDVNLPLCEGLYNGSIPSVITPPFYAYQHTAQVVSGESCSMDGSSVSGLAFYQGASYPAEYQNALFFEDYTRNCVWAMLPDTPGGIPNPANRRTIIWNTSGPVDATVGPGGDLFFAKLDSGEITRLQYFVANAPPVAVLTATPTSGPGPLAVACDASGSHDADPGDTLSYAWDLNGDGTFGDTPDADPRFAHATYSQPGSIIVSVRVTDSHAASSIASQTITVANSPPVATILTPASTLTYRVGDQISFSGRADDPDEGQLPPSALSWQTVLHHCVTLTDCHAHGIQTFSGVDHGSFVAPDHEYPSYLEIQLTAKDSGFSGWLSPAWSSRRRIGFLNASQNEDLLGFPVLIKLDSTKIDYSKTQDAGQDLRFVDLNGAVLPHQIDRWDETGTSYVWVRVPKVDAASTTDAILMYYGNATAPDGQSPSAVWDSTYSGVWHLGTSVTDSSSFANNGVNNGTTVVPGFIGSARNFNGASWIRVATAPSLELVSAATFEGWVEIADPALDEFMRILDKKADWAGPSGYDLEFNPFGGYLTVLGSGADFGRAEPLFIDTQWHWLAGTISGGTAHVYLDGVEETTDFSVTPLAPGSTPLDIGRNPAGMNYFEGALDEVRISNVARSTAWIRAQYLSMTGAFTTIGGEEGSGVLTATTSVNLLPQTKDLTFSSLPSGLQITVGTQTKTTPFTQTVITNSVNSLAVPSPQQFGGVSQSFASWSDAGAQSHEIVASQSLPPLQVTFVGALCGNGQLNAGEDCDDGNTSNGDCCAATCHVEVCNDSNGCTADSCNPATGCVFNPAPRNGTTCNDSNACTAVDTCQGGACVGGSPTLCNDSNGCTADSCNSATGLCVFNPAPLNGSACNDSQLCTLSDVCTGGTCAGSPAPDGDSDGTCNAADNCPYVSNPGQQDSGGVALPIPDGIGNACQCGNLTGDGIVDQADVSTYRAFLANPGGNPLTPAALTTCSVVGGVPSQCNILDVVVERRALLGRSPGIGQVCTAALPH
jgi:cysteine-rich repeat protein